MIFIKTHNTESRCIIGPENILLAGVCMHFSARKFYRLGLTAPSREQHFLETTKHTVVRVPALKTTCWSQEFVPDVLAVGRRGDIFQFMIRN